MTFECNDGIWGWQDKKGSQQCCQFFQMSFQVKIYYMCYLFSTEVNNKYINKFPHLESTTTKNTIDIEWNDKKIVTFKLFILLLPKTAYGH